MWDSCWTIQWHAVNFLRSLCEVIDRDVSLVSWPICVGMLVSLLFSRSSTKAVWSQWLRLILWLKPCQWCEKADLCWNSGETVYIKTNHSNSLSWASIGSSLFNVVSCQSSVGMLVNEFFQKLLTMKHYSRLKCLHERMSMLWDVRSLWERLLFYCCQNSGDWNIHPDWCEVFEQNDVNEVSFPISVGTLVNEFVQKAFGNESFAQIEMLA